MKIEYTKYGECYLPNLKAKTYNNLTIGKYGLLILNHLKSNKKTLFQSPLLQDKLTNYLINIDKKIHNKVNKLIKELAEKNNINEDLKEKDQLKWIGIMNNFKNCAEEIILKSYL